MISGRVWKYGDHVNTDLIIPGRYLDDYNAQNLAKHAMEDIDPTFAGGVRKGDVIVAGRNFGCGSSREQAPQALRAAGVGTVIVGSAARIFYRNAINVGLPIIICPAAARILESRDVAEVDLEAGTVRNAANGSCVSFSPPPGFLLDILNDGGLVPHMRKKLQQK